MHAAAAIVGMRLGCSFTLGRALTLLKWKVSIPPFPLIRFFKENKIFILSISEKLDILIKMQMHCWSS